MRPGGGTADTSVSKTDAERCVGSNPTPGTIEQSKEPGFPSGQPGSFSFRLADREAFAASGPASKTARGRFASGAARPLAGFRPKASRPYARVAYTTPGLLFS